jgi:hypothetical protein
VIREVKFEKKNVDRVDVVMPHINEGMMFFLLEADKH